jgi:hypothetical protein
MLSIGARGLVRRVLVTCILAGLLALGVLSLASSANAMPPKDANCVTSSEKPTCESAPPPPPPPPPPPDWLNSQEGCKERGLMLCAGLGWAWGNPMVAAGCKVIYDRICGGYPKRR